MRLMEATLSAQVLFSRMGFWVSLLSMFSAALTGVFTIFGLILGFLVWKQNKMREKAEKEMERINTISKDMEALYESNLDLTSKTKAMMEAARRIMEGTSKRVGKKVEEMDKLIATMKKKSKEVESVRKKIEGIRAGIKRDANSLAIVSRMMPDRPGSPDLMIDDNGKRFIVEAKAVRKPDGSIDGYVSGVKKPPQAWDQLQELLGIKKKTEKK